MSIGRHYKSGEPIPAAELDKFCAAKRIFSGVDIQSQLFYSMLDQVGVLNNGSSELEPIQFTTLCA
jgi:Zn-dependent oligopeptidase